LIPSALPCLALGKKKLIFGFAGANFASSMGNISFFFPKAKQGSALGINGGLGTTQQRNNNKYPKWSSNILDRHAQPNTRHNQDHCTYFISLPTSFFY
jgi:hypothetical protein